MVLIVAAMAIAVFVLLNHISRISSEVIDVEWPGEAPVALHEERARDQHINHLERLLTADDPTAAHRVVVDIAQRLAELPLDPEDRGLDHRTRAFLERPPLDSPTRYRRALDAVLTRIEAP